MLFLTGQSGDKSSLSTEAPNLKEISENLSLASLPSSEVSVQWLKKLSKLSLEIVGLCVNFENNIK